MQTGAATVTNIAPAQTFPPTFGVVGWKNSGKTTMTARLISEFTGRGLRVASIKHAHHGFLMDPDGTDSARHRAAGAAQVAVTSGNRWAIMTERPRHAATGAPNAAAEQLDAMRRRLDPADIVVVEGFKQAPIPKLEVRRLAAKDTAPLLGAIDGVSAIAADHLIEPGSLPQGVAVFDIDAIADIASFFLERLEVRS